MGPFDSAWWKWRWAVAHTKALLEELTAWIDDPNGRPLRIGSEYDPKHHRFRVFVTDVQSVPVTASLRLGDTISNYRMSLDHVAWAMVQRGASPNPPPHVATKVYFPFAKTLGDWNSLVGRRLPGVTHADRTVVRRYQPYRRREFRQTLGLLAELANDDKHRTIKPVFAAPRVVRFNVTNPRDCENLRAARAKGSRTTTGVGTELGYVYCRKTGPNPKIDVNNGTLDADLCITLNLKLDSWLQYTCIHIADLLCALSEPPFPWDEQVPSWAWPPAGSHRGSPAGPPSLPEP